MTKSLHNTQVVISSLTPSKVCHTLSPTTSSRYKSVYYLAHLANSLVVDVLSFVFCITLSIFVRMPTSSSLLTCTLRTDVILLIKENFSAFHLEQMATSFLVSFSPVAHLYYKRVYCPTSKAWQSIIRYWAKVW